MNSINKNILYLGVVQIVRFIIPLMTIPYLTRVLGVSGFGYLGFAAAITAYGVVLSQYGFNLTATSRIAKIKKREKLSYYCSSVYYSRFFIAILSCLMILIFLLFYGDDTLSKLVFFMLPMLLGDLLTPIWLYQGLERMKVLTIMTLLGRLVTVPLIFIFVESKDDIFIAAFLQGSAFLVTGLLSTFNIYKNNIFDVKLVSFSYLKKNISHSWNVFLTTVASSVYLNFLTIILGIVSGVESVGYFNIVQNIRNICLQCFGPIYQSTFPRISKLIKYDYREATKFTKRYLLFSFVLAVFGSLFVLVFCEEIITLLAGAEFLNAELSVKIIMLSVIFGVLNNFLGVQTLVPTGHAKTLRNIVLASSLLCLSLSFFVVSKWSYQGAALLLLFCELYIFLCFCYKHKRLKLGLVI
ncbi:MAG: oligosaccharide flippase family protein [Algicola sp.]|nr:oligosaccharide flippase family protein [Algicola sp.]